MDDSLEDLQYPIGRHDTPDTYRPELQNDWIAAIEALPAWLDVCIENLDAAQLETPYRPDGWDGHPGNSSPCRQSYEWLQFAPSWH